MLTFQFSVPGLTCSNARNCLIKRISKVSVALMYWFGGESCFVNGCYKLLSTCVCVLNAEWRIMKNRKFVGTLLEQNVRAQSKPWIMEVDG